MGFGVMALEVCSQTASTRNHNYVGGTAGPTTIGPRAEPLVRIEGTGTIHEYCHRHYRRSYRHGRMEELQWTLDRGHRDHCPCSSRMYPSWLSWHASPTN